MRLFEDDFVKFANGPAGGRTGKAPSWPPPEYLNVEGTVYRRVRFSRITDEQRESMTHVCRGAEYSVVGDTDA